MLEEESQVRLLEAFNFERVGYYLRSHALFNWNGRIPISMNLEGSDYIALRHAMVTPVLSAMT
jgi:hypothetical protein